MATKTMNVSLTEYWQGYVVGHLRRGRYQNASELVREALRLHEREQIAHDVSEVESLFGASRRAEGDAEVEQIKGAVMAARQDRKGRSR